MSSSTRTAGATPRRHHSDPVARTAASSRFLPVRLTEERLDTFHSAAHTALSRTIKEFVKLDGKKTINTQQWRYMRSRNGTSVYRDRHQEQNAQRPSLLVAGTVKARLADVMDGLYMDTTEDSRLVQHRIHPRFVDAEVLSVIEQRSTERPFNFTGLKWALIKSSNTGIVSNRDICFFEKLGTIAIADGRTLGYFIMESVNLPECPPSPSSKVVRANISLCYLFEETNNGLVGVYMTGNMVSFGPKMLWKIARNNFADIVLSIGHAVDIAYAKRYTQLMRAKHEMPESSPSPSAMCESCKCFPSFFDRHRQCSGCSKMTVCQKCRIKQEIFHREDSTSLQLARASFCFTCMERVRKPCSMQRTGVGQQSIRNEGSSERPNDDCVPRRRELFTSNSRRTGVHKNGSIGSSSSSTTASVSGSIGEPNRDSERSLGLFMQRVRDQLDEVKYDELDATSRLSELAMLGSGACPRDTNIDSDNERASGLTSNSVDSSIFSICDVDMDSLDSEDDDTILSIRPVRRSLQPPEMLQAQKLSWDGSLLLSPMMKHRLPTVGSSSFDSNRDLISRLERASRLAEQTHRLTKEQGVLHEHRFYAPTRLGSVTL